MRLNDLCLKRFAFYSTIKSTKKERVQRNHQLVVNNIASANNFCEGTILSNRLCCWSRLQLWNLKYMETTAMDLKIGQLLSSRPIVDVSYYWGGWGPQRWKGILVCARPLIIIAGILKSDDQTHWNYHNVEWPGKSDDLDLLYYSLALAWPEVESSHAGKS